MRTVAQLRREQHEAIPVNKDSLYPRAFAVCATAHFPHAAHCAPSAVRQQRVLRPRRRVPAWPLLRGANMSGASYAFSLINQRAVRLLLVGFPGSTGTSRSSGANGSSTRSKSRRNCRRVPQNACGHAWPCTLKRFPVARLAHAKGSFVCLCVRPFAVLGKGQSHSRMVACMHSTQSCACAHITVSHAAACVTKPKHALHGRPSCRSRASPSSK